MKAPRVVGRGIEVIIISPGSNPSIAPIVGEWNSLPNLYSTERSASGGRWAFHVKIRIVVIAVIACGNKSCRQAPVNHAQ
jgi:hypothetical protein